MEVGLLKKSNPMWFYVHSSYANSVNCPLVAKLLLSPLFSFASTCHNFRQIKKTRNLKFISIFLRNESSYPRRRIRNSAQATDLGLPKASGRFLQQTHDVASNRGSRQCRGHSRDSCCQVKHKLYFFSWIIWPIIWGTLTGGFYKAGNFGDGKAGHLRAYKVTHFSI